MITIQRYLKAFFLISKRKKKIVQLLDANTMITFQAYHKYQYSQPRLNIRKYVIQNTLVLQPQFRLSFFL